MWRTASSQLAVYGPIPSISLHCHCNSRFDRDEDRWVVFIDTREEFDRVEVCDGPWTAFEVLETLIELVEDGDTKSKSGLIASAETEEMPQRSNWMVSLLLVKILNMSQRCY